MENNLNSRKNVSKRVSVCLIAALFMVGIVGFYAFTPYSGENTTIKTDGVTSIAGNWKTFSNSYLTFKYPDTYKISDQEQSEDSYELCCELKGDDIAMVHISVTEMGDDLGDLDESLRELVLTVGVSAMKEELESTSTYKNFTPSEIKQVTKGRNTGYSFTFTAKILTFPVQGECFMALSGDRLLTLVSQAENATYMSQLNQIIEGIRVK